MLIRHKPTQLRVLPLLVASLFCANAQAQQSGTQLEDVRVESGIIPDDLELVPGSTEVLSNKELEERRPFSINELMRETTGFNVVGEDSFGVAPNIGLRGLNPRRSARTLLLEDGMPLFWVPTVIRLRIIQHPLIESIVWRFLRGLGKFCMVRKVLAA